jgi:hypothetical protein
MSYYLGLGKHFIISTILPELEEFGFIADTVDERICLQSNFGACTWTLFKYWCVSRDIIQILVRVPAPGTLFKYWCVSRPFLAPYSPFLAPKILHPFNQFLPPPTHGSFHTPSFLGSIAY